MHLYGLIGYPLSHSFSQNYFRKKFKDEGIINHDYLNFPIKDISEITDVLANNPNLHGFNVTIPYKEQIIPFLDELSPAAEKIAAVNTVKVIKNGSTTILKGYNTDTYGFEQSLKPFLVKTHKNALILGTGGASKAVAYVLRQLNINYLFVSRKAKSKQQISYLDLERTIIEKHTLIINTSPLGMFPKIDFCPDIPYRFLNENHLLFDLIYNPEKTKFMKNGESRNAKTANGYNMLALQAEKAWEIFTTLR
jgi:shikimate dehydrogenase